MLPYHFRDFVRVKTVSNHPSLIHSEYLANVFVQHARWFNHNGGNRFALLQSMFAFIARRVLF
jgi:hypothetical protein